MDCNHCVERLYAFLDLELSDTEITAIRLHLEGCVDCAGETHLEVRFLEQLRDCATSDVAPARLRELVRDKLRGGDRPPV